MAEAVVGIVMGSDSDWPLVKKACETLDKFGVAYETRVISAHRTPDVAIEYSRLSSPRPAEPRIWAEFSPRPRFCPLSEFPSPAERSTVLMRFTRPFRCLRACLSRPSPSVAQVLRTRRSWPFRFSVPQMLRCARSSASIRRS